MKIDRRIYLLILIWIIVYYLILPRGYISWYKSIPVFPNNYKEIEIVKSYVKDRTREDEKFFRFTNKHIVPVYKLVVNEDIDTLIEISDENLISFTIPNIGVSSL